MSENAKLPSEEKEAEYSRLAEHIFESLDEFSSTCPRLVQIHDAIVRFYAEEK